MEKPRPGRLRRRLKMLAAFVAVSILLVVVLAWISTDHFRAFGGAPSGARLDRMRASARFVGGKFQNVEPTALIRSGASGPRPRAGSGPAASTRRRWRWPTCRRWTRSSSRTSTTITWTWGLRRRWAGAGSPFTFRWASAPTCRPGGPGGDGAAPRQDAGADPLGHVRAGVSRVVGAGRDAARRSRQARRRRAHPAPRRVVAGGRFRRGPDFHHAGPGGHVVGRVAVELAGRPVGRHVQAERGRRFGRARVGDIALASATALVFQVGMGTPLFGNGQSYDQGDTFALAAQVPVSGWTFNK